MANPAQGIARSAMRSYTRPLCTRRASSAMAGSFRMSRHVGESILTKPTKSSESLPVRMCAAATDVIAADTSSAAAPKLSLELEGADQFDFSKAWYPVGIVDDLDPTLPWPVTLLQQDLVVWRDGEGVWRCFEDRCPHRLVPLSDGRLEKDGTLSCAYHGWRFNGEGACTAIPQISDAKALATATASPRSCVRTHPTKVAQGLLWVWASSGPGAEQEAAATSPRLLPEFEGPDGAEWNWSFRPFMRDLPYSYDVLLENVADPSHVPFSHHGVQGSRERPTRFRTTVDSVDKVKGVATTLHLEGQDNQDKPFGRLFFEPPCLLRYEFASRATLNSYAIPTRPGYVRAIVSGACHKDSKSFFRFFRHFPRWLDHAVQRNEVLDGDSAFLRIGEENLRKGGNRWSKDFYMPATTDGTIAAVRGWLDQYAGSTGPAASTGAADLPRLPQSVALDRYESHTKNCPSCKKALQVFTQLQWVATAAAIMCAAAAVATAKAATGLAALLQPQVGWWLAGAALLMWLRSGFASFATRYTYRPYVHGHR